MTDNATLLAVNGPEHSNGPIDSVDGASTNTAAANTASDYKTTVSTAEMANSASVSVNGIKPSDSQSNAKYDATVTGTTETKQPASSTDKKVNFNIDYAPELPSIAELMASDDEQDKGGKEDDAEGDAGPADLNASGALGAGVGQKKKRKKKPKSQRGLVGSTHHSNEVSLILSIGRMLPQGLKSIMWTLL